MRRGTEQEFELTTIERIEALGYRWQHGDDIERPHDEVVLRGVLRANLAKRYADLPPAALDAAVARIARPDGADVLRRNLDFHERLTRGFELPVKRADGSREIRHIHPIDWDRPEANDFRVVNQFKVRGKNDRRPDIVLFVNGLPLVLFELKNPHDATATVDGALNQVEHYRNEIPQLFEFNALVVVSDGVRTLHGQWTSSREWFAAWKSIDGVTVEAGTTASMKALVEGLLPKERLLAYAHDFVLFEVVHDRITKKGARYHQFFAVRAAADRAVHVMTASGDKRAGVVWHTTGSGKSLSIVFLVGILRRHRALKNPTIVIEVDRTDLDDQIHDQFVAARSLVGDVKQAENVEDLRRLLRGGGGGEVVFTTIEKFRLKPGETRHEELTARDNVLVIADEAHRTQYGFKQGFARFLAEALPNARLIAFTATPVNLTAADTVSVFGDVIHRYDIRQSQEDHATVPIHYEPRLVRLHLGPKDVDAALDEIAAGREPTEVERKKSRWAALAAAAGAKERVAEVARDVLSHFLDRTRTLAGKAMIVCMTRENCVRMFDALRALPNCPEIKVIMTGDLEHDPPEWSEAGHYTTKEQRDSAKARMVDASDPLKIVIVCDMWLTGTDIPCLHTLYVDKPMRGHNVIQAISRVNRVFKDKPHGMVVDYIGIGDELRAATEQYSGAGGRGDPAPEIGPEAVRVFMEALEEARALLPKGLPIADWRGLGRVALEDLYARAYGFLAEDDSRRDAFLAAEARLSKAYLLVKHRDDCRGHADAVIFCQRTRHQLAKTLPGRPPELDLDRAVRDLVDDSVESEGVVDIFAAAGLPRADISILDDAFLQTFKGKPHEDLRMKLLERLLSNEIAFRERGNLAKAKSFRALLDETLRKYHARVIDAAQVIKVMLEIRKEQAEQDARAQRLGLDATELALFDAIAIDPSRGYDEPFLRDLIHDVVAAIKSEAKFDWTNREQQKAAVRAAVRRVLRKRLVRDADLEPFTERLIEQAVALCADWPQAA